MGREEMGMLWMNWSNARRLAIAGAAITMSLLLPPAVQASPVRETGVQLIQYHPYGSGYYGGGRPPCRAVNNPWGGAARGAAGGAIIGGIAGNAGRGAAIGAGVGFLGRSIRNSNARANGYCY
jgi:hypothetical protein